MIEFILPLLQVYLSSDLMAYWFFPMFACCFVGAVPGFIRLLTRWR